MTTYKVITESGADYVVNFTNRFWWHRGDGPYRLWKFQVATHGGDIHTPGYRDGDWRDATEPVVGRRMYLMSRDYWRISTEVISFEETEED